MPVVARSFAIAFAFVASIPVVMVSLRAENLPADISAFASQIGLESPDWHPFGKRPDLEGKLAGTWVEINFSHDGKVEEIEACHDDVFSAKAIEPVVPRVLRESSDYPADARFSKIKFDAHEYEIEGRTVKGEWFEVKFDSEGHLLKWESK